MAHNRTAGTVKADGHTEVTWSVSRTYCATLVLLVGIGLTGCSTKVTTGSASTASYPSSASPIVVVQTPAPTPSPTATPTTTPAPTPVPTPMPPALVYQIGGAGTAVVTYFVGPGLSEEQQTVSLPWQLAPDDPPQIATINAQHRSGGDGPITCTITEYGNVVATAQSSGAYALVQCVPQSG